MIRLVDAARVDPKVLQAIRGSLRAAERELSIPRLALASVLLDVLKGDLLVIVTPGVRKDGIRGDVVDQVLSQAESPVASAL